jgi:hypothetical protein
VAEGWGGHNIVHRLETTAGSWAVEQLGRNEVRDPEAAFHVEMAAWDGGVPMARLVATIDGHCGANLDGLLYRCHEWIEGTIKQNEETSVADHRHGPPNGVVGIESEAHPVVVAGRGARGEGWITGLSCGFVWMAWGSRCKAFPAGRRRFMRGSEPPAGEHSNRQGRLSPTTRPCPRWLVRRELTAGGMTSPLSTDH